MVWIRAIGSVLKLTVRPLAKAEWFWGWVEVIIILLLLLGLISTGIVVHEVRWLATIVAPSLFALLVFIAAVRLQKRLTDTKVERTPLPSVVLQKGVVNIKNSSRIEFINSRIEQVPRGTVAPSYDEVDDSSLSNPGKEGS